MPGAEPVEVRAILPAQVEHVLEALGRHERRPRAAPLQQRVRRDRRPVREALELVRADRRRRGEHRLLLVACRRHLRRAQLAASSRTASVKVPPTSMPRMATGGIYGPSSIGRVKLLLVSLYWPPAGGGGVQRPLKFAQYLPALGIETHVLAPDDSKWIHQDADLRQPTQAWVHRARYIGPKGRKPAEELHGKQGARARARAGEARVAAPARPGRERELEPDRDPRRDPDRAQGGDRRRRHDLAAELDPPRRRRGEEGDRGEVGRRPARLARRASAPARREHGRAREGEGRRGRRAARRPLGRRDHLRLGRDRRRGARLLAAAGRS